MVIDRTWASPNHSARADHPISMVVLHATVGSAQSALAWLTEARARVSAHYLVDKRGKVYQLVEDSRAAWHAGQATWQGESAINECSLGIELENANDGRDAYPPPQQTALLELLRAKVQQYDIVADNVVRHLDVARPRGRKTDPAAFPMAELLRQLFPAAAPPAAAPPPRPLAGDEAALLGQRLLQEAYRQVGAVEQPDWAFGTFARSHKLGLPVKASFQVAAQGRSYLGQAFGADVLVSPLGEWQRIQRLSELTAPAQQPLRTVLLEATYAQAGETYHPDWAFHQYALAHPVGPPLDASTRTRVDGQAYVLACYARDVLVSPVDAWQRVQTLTELLAARDPHAQTLAAQLQARLYERAGSQVRPDWPPFQVAWHERLGAPLGPSFRVAVAEHTYVAEAFALDVLYCEAGDWKRVKRLLAGTR